jgi:hypothetical protein
MTTTPPPLSDVDAAMRDRLPVELVAALELLTDYPIPVEVVAAIHAAGTRTRTDPTRMHVVNATEVLLVAVDDLPRIGDRYAGTLDSDPAPYLPALDERGLLAGTPAPPDGLPAHRFLLWEWATRTPAPLAEQIDDDPGAAGWPAYPPLPLLRDTYGADPRPWACYAVYAHRCVAAFQPYTAAVDALARLDQLTADTTATVTTDQITDLAARASGSHNLPAYAAARDAVLDPAGRGVVDLVTRARDARTRWSGTYPVGIHPVRDVPTPAFDMLASRISQSMTQLAPGEVATLARTALDRQKG